MRETEEIEERNGGESRLAGTACAVADTRHAAPRDHKVTPPAGRTRFRADVEGLRAIALLVVLLYHAEVAWLPGGYVGVDIFFVISGFLITGLLLREVEHTGRVRLGQFYARRMRRLLPAALVVLAATVLLAWAVMSPVERTALHREVISAAVYLINWKLASDAVAYSEAGTDASAIQHFWSLAVEEQFYLVWPLLIIGVALACRRIGGHRLRLWLGIVLGALAAVSFAYAVYLTAEQGQAAYFTTTTRAWELGAGALLALVPVTWWQRVKGGRRTAFALAGAGVALIALAVYRLNDDTAFPGPWAALPVAGAVAVIAAGQISTDTPVARALSTRPMRYLGRLSYSWYLWHWPVVVLATVWLGDLPSTLLLLAIALSWIPAALTHHFVEDPVRHARMLRATGASLALGAACTAAAVAVATVAQTSVPTIRLASPDEATGAAAMAGATGPQRSASVLRPLPENASDDHGQAADDGCLADPDVSSVSDGCVYGDRSADQAVVLFGDSHAQQYFAALDPIAKEHGWQLVVLTKSSCSPADVTLYHNQFQRAYEECDTWREEALARIEAIEPVLVVTANRGGTTVMADGKRLDAEASAEAMTEGYVRTLERLEATGAEVAVIANTPFPTTDVPSCVSENLGHLTECAFDVEDGLAHEQVNNAAARAVPAAHLIDPVPQLCLPDGTCPAVMGNTLIYRNGTHLTASYVRTMTDWLDERITGITGS